MASALYYGKDEKVESILATYFKHRLEDTGEKNEFTRLDDEKKFLELLKTAKFDVIFIEQNFLSKGPDEWLVWFKRMVPELTSHMVLVGSLVEANKILKNIEAGWVDYIAAPADRAMLIEKFNLYATGARNKDERQVYSLATSIPSDLAKHGVLEELSELDCKMRLAFEVKAGETFILYSSAFSENMKDAASVLVKCYETAPHTAFKGLFLSSFYFLGLSNETLGHIRTSLRKTYVSSKNKG